MGAKQYGNERIMGRFQGHNTSVLHDNAFSMCVCVCVCVCVRYFFAKIDN